jgi:predicted ATPase
MKLPALRGQPPSPFPLPDGPTSLARLRGEQGRRAEGHKLLAPVHGWFTEGFDIADLKEAKGLLDQLT